MKNATHATPGPWEVFPSEWTAKGNDAEFTFRLHARLAGKRDIFGEGHANARLIAAAPLAVDFAEACLQARRWFEGNLEGALEEIESRAEAFLAKATGDTP